MGETVNESCFTELMGKISMQSTARDLTGASVERMVGAVGKFQIMNYIIVDSDDEGTKTKELTLETKYE